MSSIRGSRALPDGRRGGLAASQKRVSLSETLDRVLNKGVVVVGDVIISVAGIDLVYIGVNLVLCSVETMRQSAASRLPLGQAAQIGA